MEGGPLDLGTDVVELAARLIDIPSASGAEGPIADLVAAALAKIDTLRVRRDGNTVVATTELGRPRRVVIAGHLDTVPAAGNLPHRREGERISGLGATDMKGGVAVALRLAATVVGPRHDITYVFYDCEEVTASRNGLGRVAVRHPEWITGDLAILMEPSDACVELGCQGSIRAELTVRGARAHSARWWLGSNAIHRATDVLDTLDAYQARRVMIDGLEYRDGLSAVRISGGVAGNIVPDECVITVNFRYAPDLSEADARSHLVSLFPSAETVIVDSVPAARPGLDTHAIREFIADVSVPVAPKYGWTDVARFAALGIPAVNYGPGDPHLAHKPEEWVSVDQLVECERVLRGWLEADDG